MMCTLGSPLRTSFWRQFGKPAGDPTRASWLKTAWLGCWLPTRPALLARELDRALRSYPRALSERLLNSPRSSSGSSEWRIVGIRGLDEAPLDDHPGGGARVAVGLSASQA